MYKLDRKAVVALIVVIAVLVIGWANRYPIMYHYYMAKIETNWGVDKWEPYKDIKVIAPQVVPQLVETYNDTNTSGIRRYAAGAGLLEVDKTYAETVFTSMLGYEDEDIVQAAIVHLGSVGSQSSYEKILAMSGHKNPDVRSACLWYFASCSEKRFNKDKSLDVLKNKAANDPDKDVRKLAEFLYNTSINGASAKGELM